VLPVSQLRVISHLPNRVGYVDLGRPTPHEASAAFDEISDTRAMVFELRRYPRSTGMLVAERLAERPVIGAQLRCPLPTGSLADASPWWHNTMMDRYVKHLIRPRGWRYPGRVVALADSDTISQGEHTALFLEAAASATSIGTPTHGTDGNVASVGLADGVSALYTGLDVRHGDRRQLQRVGIEPHVMSGQLSNSSDHCHPGRSRIDNGQPDTREDPLKVARTDCD
jgi:hypothetical protein